MSQLREIGANGSAAEHAGMAVVAAAEGADVSGGRAETTGLGGGGGLGRQ